MDAFPQPPDSTSTTDSADIAVLRDFIQPHLDRVSRSFARGIRQLSPDLGRPVGLSYLICRLLDTIEDAPWKQREDRSRAFDAFDGFLKNGAPDSDVHAWAQAFPEGLPEGERLLLMDAERVFAEYRRLPLSDQRAILQPVLSMSRGMRGFLESHRTAGEVLRLSSLGDVQLYCFFVAGVVGEVLTELVRLRAITRPITPQRGVHFGLFLQKVNILKDQKADEAEGRYLVPSRDAVLASMQTDAREAMNYIEALPLELKSYRVFCAWALLLGLASLPLIQRGYRSGHGPEKLPRLEALWLAQKIDSRISNPEALRGMYDDLIVMAFADCRAGRSSAPAGAPFDDAKGEGLLALYSGQIALQDLKRILKPTL